MHAIFIAKLKLKPDDGRKTPEINNWTLHLSILVFSAHTMLTICLSLLNYIIIIQLKPQNLNMKSYASYVCH